MSTFLTMPDADIFLLEGAFSPLRGTDYLRQLTEDIIWREETIRLFGKTYLQPRLLAFYGDEGVSYTYSRKRYNALPWTDLIGHLRSVAAEVGQAPFNSVLANLYRNERDSMGFHADDEPELGIEPTIVSMSFGQARTIIFKHKSRKDISPVRIRLESESILVMKGSTQQSWVHGIQKETRTLGPRINLTFRQIFR